MSATCELLRGHDFNSYDGNVLELAVSREVVYLFIYLPVKRSGAETKMYLKMFHI